MIFVTVGTQLPFDRMIRAVDDWAGRSDRADVFAQVGPSTYVPRHIRVSQFVSAGEFRDHVSRAQVVIAHAGMGSIITALELGKPIVVMPRRADLGEHRNDHQLATARRFLAQGRVIVACDEAHLEEKLNTLRRMTAAAPISRQASPRLLAAIKAFVEGRSDRDALAFVPDMDVPAAQIAQRAMEEYATERAGSQTAGAALV
jgi:UDP-N-acetylglucosamine transferase subunit ALG13